MALWRVWRRCAVVLAVVGSLLAPVPSAGASGGGALPAKGPVWSGSALQPAVDLGDIAGQSDPVFRRTRMEDAGGAAASAGDWRDYCFDLSDSRKVGLGLRQLDHDADLYLLTSGGGAVLGSGSTVGTASEWVEVSLRAGSYCARVAAVEAGENHFVFRYGVGPADPDSLLPEPAPEPAPDTDTGSGSGSESDSETDTGSGSESDSETGTGSGSDTDTGSEPGSDSDTDTGAESESESGSRSRSDTGSGSDTDTGSESESDPVSGAVAGVLWSAVMVVGEDELRGDAAFGYSVHTALGSLDSTVLSDGKTVYYLAHVPALGELYLGVSPRLDDEASLVLAVGGVDFAVADATVEKRNNWHYVWDAPGVGWAVGDSVEVSLRVAEPEPGELSGLAVSGVSGVGFDPGDFDYGVTADAGTASVTVAPVVRAGTAARVLVVRAQGELRFDPADADPAADGHQAALSGSGDTLVVAATDDGTAQRAYVVHIAPPPASTPSTPPAGTPSTPPATTPSTLPAATLSPPPAATPPAVTPGSQPASQGVSAATVRGLVLSGASASVARGPAVPGAYSAAVGVRSASSVAVGARKASPAVAGASTASVRGASESAPGNSVRRSDAPSRQNASLASLSVSDTLSQTADSNGIPVAATVAAEASRVTVTAVTAHSEASYTITPDDADADADGHQVDLLEPDPGGDPTQTVVVVAVRSADSQVLQSYALIITRQAPPPESPSDDPPERQTGFVDIDVGWDHACAIRVGGQVVCWGDIVALSAWYTPRRQPLYPAKSPPTPGPYVDVTAGQYTSCGVLADGTAHCWAGGAQPPAVPGGTFEAVSHHSWSGPLCSLGADGAARCRDAASHYDGHATGHVDDFGGARFQSLHAGQYDTACGLTTDGEILCSARGEARQAPSGKFTSIGYGGVRGCGIRADSTLECWSISRSGHNRSIAIPPAGEFVQVDSNSFQTCGLRNDGDAVCWYNRDVDSCTILCHLRGWWDYDEDVVVTEGPFQQVSAGFGSYACGLRTDGSIECWDPLPRVTSAALRPPPVADDESRLASLDVSGAGRDVELGFDPGTTSYSVDVANDVAVVTVAADPFGVFAGAVVSPADSDPLAEGHQVALAVGATTAFTVTVTAQDGVSSRVYTVALVREPAVEQDARLAGLRVEGWADVALGDGVFDYSLEVPAAAATVTVVAVPSAGGAAVVFASPDTDAGVEGHQVTLDGDNPVRVTITVTAPNGVNTQTYTVTVARQRPPLTGAFVGAPGSHDGETAFSFRMTFTEPVDVTADDLKDDVLVVSGGAVSGVAAVGDDGTTWEVTLVPDSSLAAVVIVEADAGCESAGAVCTAGGKRLSERMRLYVQGPGNTLATGRPAVSGTPRAGVTLTADTSAIRDRNGLERARAGQASYGFAYQWIRRDGGTDTAIAGARSASYTPTDADVGKRLRVKVSFADDELYHESRTSRFTGAVATRANAAARGAPTISGTTRAGETLTADISDITDPDGTAGAAFSYQWIRTSNGTDADIAGATAASYTLADADESATVKVRVSFTDGRGYSESLTSEATATVAAAPPWHATMTVGEAVNANGYNSRAGSLTSAAFEADGTSYTVSEILAWEFMYITVDTALPVGWVLEVNGSQFALDDADAATYGYGTVYYWGDADLTWPQGAQVSLAIYPQG